MASLWRPFKEKKRKPGNEVGVNLVVDNKGGKLERDWEQGDTLTDDRH